MVLLGSRQHRSPLLQFAMSWGPHIVVKCIVCDIRVLLPILKVQCIAVNVRFFYSSYLRKVLEVVASSLHKHI